jgi:hypothetical protein
MYSTPQLIYLIQPINLPIVQGNLVGRCPKDLVKLALLVQMGYCLQILLQLLQGVLTKLLTISLSSGFQLITIAFQVPTLFAFIIPLIIILVLAIIPSFIIFPALFSIFHAKFNFTHLITFTIQILAVSSRFIFIIHQESFIFLFYFIASIQ